MRYLKSSVKVQLGDKIRVNVSRPTRVLVMTEINYNRYKENLTFTYYGGIMDASYELSVPNSGSWLVIVEKGSNSKPLDIRASVIIDRTERLARAAQKQSVLASEEVSKKDKKKKKKSSEIEDSQELDLLDISETEDSEDSSLLENKY